MAEISPLAGKPAPESILVDVARLVDAYRERRPDPSVPAQRVVFGTSGHRGSSLDTAFNEAHILAITQAICLYRKREAIDGPLFIGFDTHALSKPAFVTALEVLAANGVDVMVDARDGYTPTPVVSHAVLRYNRGRRSGLADGIVITPSHNPPQYGGFKYDPPHGGPADTHVTRWIEERANAFLADGLRGVSRVPFDRASSAPTTHPDVSLHDRRLGRPDSHGPVVAVRDGAHGRLEGPVRRGLRERHRCRPPWHREPQHRAPRAEPLPRRRDRIPLYQPRQVAGFSRRRQDSCQQHHDRSGGSASRTAA